MQQRLEFDGERPRGPGRVVFTVTQLTTRITAALERGFASVWVEGEVSNLTVSSAGHCYFVLKDADAQLRCVVWKTQARLLRFRPKDGLKVVARGGLRVYPTKGEYQLQVEVIEPLGKGALQQAFEELKERLDKEGLFEAARKRPLPLLPRRVGVVTSPQGAVIQDILRVLHGRFENIDVLIYPARVQGEEAAFEIVQGIRALNRVPDLDVLIVARGGGSLEDLWPFNEERVARALAASRLPTISAVGHETDFTIADFVADLRAPTPSAAAERVVQAKHELTARIEGSQRRLLGALRLRLERVRRRVAAATAHRVFEAERGRLKNLAQRVDELERRGRMALARRLERADLALRRSAERLAAFTWERQLSVRRERLRRPQERLTPAVRALLEARRARLGQAAARLDSLSPLAVLGRGYALVFAADGRLVRDPAALTPGEALRVRVAQGAFQATVTRKEIP
jgi:exodeoxyribonuclease VII large subunit